MWDAIIIGAGFYGCSLALHLKRVQGLEHVLVIEKEEAVLRRASYVNQARVHNGYHYPRSFPTAYRSRVNLPRFVKECRAAVVDDFTKIYAIGRAGSKVTARQFERFCQDIGAELSPAPPAVARLFNDRLIEAAYTVREFSFDTTVLASALLHEMAEAGVALRLGTRVTHVDLGRAGAVGIAVNGPGGDETLAARFAFNCTYAGLGHVLPELKARLKHEITEIGLVELPEPIRQLGITVMDGPFFSTMPFPARKLHSFSHVRYTPHVNWMQHEHPDRDPYAYLADYDRQSRLHLMIRDAARLMPILLETRPVDSLFEVKTVLVANESNDGRPILIERSGPDQRLFNVLGSKIDNIYDCYETVDQAIGAATAAAKGAAE